MTFLNSTTHTMENTVMIGVSIIILQVMHLMLLGAAQSAQTVPTKDMLLYLGKNNDPWESIIHSSYSF